MAPEPAECAALGLDSLKVLQECEGLLLWSIMGWSGGCAQVAGCGKGSLQFVQEVVQGRDAFLQAFTLACFGHHLAGATGVVKGVSGQDLPVVKYTLREGLATCVGPQVGGEACRKRQGQSSLDSQDVVLASYFWLSSRVEKT